MKNMSLRILLLLLLMSSCYQDMDDVPYTASELSIKNFIWRGMNKYYLYKPEVPELADDRFSGKEELNDYLAQFASPEDLFYEGLVAPGDQFSFLVEDYRELERLLDGINNINGMEYGLSRYSTGSDLVLGYVRYVLPGTSADDQGLRRGDLFNTVDGQQLTVDNYYRLLQPEVYTIGLAEFQGDQIVSTGEEINLEKQEYTEDPIYFSSVIPTSAGKVGYLMYNAFTGDFDPYLNDTFGNFKSEGITDLILDLRYNGGGNVESATDLGSMITGQFEGEIFHTEQWNPQMQEYLQTIAPESLVNLFDDEISNGTDINNLGLTRLYVLTTLSTASASELLINSLSPYIQVIQIGAPTTGKYQASTTLYDSPDFNRSGANPGHTYAIQPLIYKTVNAAGVTDYAEGLMPDIEIFENLRNLGTIGDINEPLLKTALDHITGNPVQEDFRHLKAPDIIGESGSDEILYQKMYAPNELALQ